MSTTSIMTIKQILSNPYELSKNIKELYIEWNKLRINYYQTNCLNNIEQYIVLCEITRKFHWLFHMVSLFLSIYIDRINYYTLK